MFQSGRDPASVRLTTPWKAGRRRGRTERSTWSATMTPSLLCWMRAHLRTTAGAGSADRAAPGGDSRAAVLRHKERARRAGAAVLRTGFEVGRPGLHRASHAAARTHSESRLRRRSWICARSVSHRDRAWAVTSSHWRRTSSSAGRSPRRMRSSSSWTSRPAAAEPTTDDHDAEERRDHREDRADHAVAGGVRAEEVRDVHRRADRVDREQRRSEDARTGGGPGARSAWR